MKTSFNSIAAILIGLFGIIAGILNKGTYLGFWWYGKQPSKDTQRTISIFLGAIALFVGLALLRKLNIH
ncbi:MAG TPA: hypothetical protein VGP55_16515 [Chitinophagaceae bacterium]|nr:hypothetical protein [Chitinophagaceae bacterium]